PGCAARSARPRARRAARRGRTPRSATTPTRTPRWSCLVLLWLWWLGRCGRPGLLPLRLPLGGARGPFLLLRRGLRGPPLLPHGEARADPAGHVDRGQTDVGEHLRPFGVGEELLRDAEPPDRHVDLGVAQCQRHGRTHPGRAAVVLDDGHQTVPGGPS